MRYRHIPPAHGSYLDLNCVAYRVPGPILHHCTPREQPRLRIHRFVHFARLLAYSAEHTAYGREYIRPRPGDGVLAAEVSPQRGPLAGLVTGEVGEREEKLPQGILDSLIAVQHAGGDLRVHVPTHGEEQHGDADVEVLEASAQAFEEATVGDRARSKGCERLRLRVALGQGGLEGPHFHLVREETTCTMG